MTGHHTPFEPQDHRNIRPIESGIIDMHTQIRFDTPIKIPTICTLLWKGEMKSAHDKDQAMEARFALYGRVLRCPLGGNPSDCPLHDLRRLPVEKRIAWLESLTDKEVIDLYQQHNACLECKLKDNID